MSKEHVDVEVEGERLRRVRVLIEELLREADICGQVVLAGRAGRFENFTHLAATWCKVSIERMPAGEALRIRSRAVDYGGDRELQHQHLEWSAGMVAGFAEIGGRTALDWLDATKVINAATRAEHSPLERVDPRDEP